MIGLARRRLSDRVAGIALRAGTRLLLALPDRLLHRVAHVAGAGLYLAWPERRALVRSNL